MAETIRGLDIDLVEDTGISISPGIRVEPELPGPYMTNNDDPTGPTVGVNTPSPDESRFVVHNPIFRKVHRTTKSVSGTSIVHRAGEYKTSTSNGSPFAETINYDIIYEVPSNTIPIPSNKRVISNTVEDQYYGAWDYFDKSQEGSGNRLYGNIEYYREGSRVYFQGRCAANKSYDGETNTYNEYPIVLDQTTGKPVGTSGVIFKLPVLYRPMRRQLFLCPVLVKQLNILSSPKDIHSLATIVINPDGVVELLNIIADGVDNSNLIAKNDNNTLAGYYKITWLNMDNINFTLYSGPNVYNAMGAASSM